MRMRIGKWITKGKTYVALAECDADGKELWRSKFHRGPRRHNECLAELCRHDKKKKAA